ncbi:membrane protein [Luteimicrobium album]|uniref:Membrane protein n=1 Tax=Luteimicrobium album TaxID=1054550 RepID=A0ABQ6I7R4_9MICO|nr:NfeD family protein [Luteimicrobium album]GMA26267.1 membrane protein [Luteimicrobium album]
MDWLWWIGAALLFAVVEVVTLSFVLIMFAGGALVAAVANALGWPFWVQVVVFGVVSTILLLTFRRWLVLRFHRSTPRTLTNADALVGREAVVLAPVSESGGRVKLSGEVWTARVPRGALELPTGDHVRVVRIEGATAVVEPLALGTGTADPATAGGA